MVLNADRTISILQDETNLALADGDYTLTVTGTIEGTVSADLVYTVSAWAGVDICRSVPGGLSLVGDATAIIEVEVGAIDDWVRVAVGLVADFSPTSIYCSA
jgi:hypothetical protein